MSTELGDTGESRGDSIILNLSVNLFRKYLVHLLLLNQIELKPIIEFLLRQKFLRSSRTPSPNHFADSRFLESSNLNCLLHYFGAARGTRCKVLLSNRLRTRVDLLSEDHFKGREFLR